MKLEANRYIVQKYYPVRLADNSWDNTGLLVDASTEKIESNEINVLLTVDLTQSVTEEAISNKCKVIMAYHPFIFRGLKSITSDDPQQRSLLKLIQNNISVYCPHTAVDSANGGVNDFLVKAITEEKNIASKEVIEKNEELENCGMGRIVNVREPILLGDVVERVKKTLGLDKVQVARARNQDSNQEIRQVAICAGSGGSLFKGLRSDLYFTGELFHHQTLYLTESGSTVIACHHSNTERAFLSVMAQQLETEIPQARILISQQDKDPYDIW